jgi:hypothetical protein
MSYYGCKMNLRSIDRAILQCFQYSDRYFAEYINKKKALRLVWCKSSFNSRIVLQKGKQNERRKKHSARPC